MENNNQMNEKVLSLSDKSKKKIKINIYGIIVGTILFLYTVSVLLPLIWGFMTTFKPDIQWNKREYLELPNMQYWQVLAEANKKNPANFKNYTNLFGNYIKFFADSTVKRPAVSYYIGFNLDKKVVHSVESDFFDLLVTTLLYAGGTSVCAAMAPCMMGYLCSKFNYKFSKFIYVFVITVMAMPLAGNQAALLNLTRRLSMHDTIWGTWIRAFTFANSNFLIFFAFFEGMSDTYGEAAQIDGASYFRVMWTIYMPLALKTISTIFLLQFVAHYNDYQTSVLYMPSHLTLAYAVHYFSVSSGSGNVPFNITAAMILCLPILILFIVFKDKLMGNISLGGVKE